MKKSQARLTKQEAASIVAFTANNLPKVKAAVQPLLASGASITDLIGLMGEGDDGAAEVQVMRRAEFGMDTVLRQLRGKNDEYVEQLSRVDPDNLYVLVLYRGVMTLVPVETRALLSPASGTGGN